MVINSISSLTHMPLADVTDDLNFATLLESKVKVSAINTGKVRTKQGKMVDGPTLARRWMIPPERAKTTVHKTTQRGVREVLYPTLTRRFPTNDKML